MRLELLEVLIKDVEAGKQEFIKFTNIVDAASWALSEGEPGSIIVVKLEEGWVPHVIEDDKSLSPICNDAGEMVTINLDGDNADGIDGEVEVIQYFDGGSAAGI